ncbi:MAG TPA: Ig-like domain-containing protein [Terriglobales bacterium]|nr:Ig-like domain-containing protein [Terriglobales bacterium]
MRRSPATFAAILTVLTALLMLSACGGGGSSSSKNNVATVELSPAAASINVGSTSLAFTATAKDSSGNVLGNQTFTFAAKDPTDASATPFVSVANSGLVCAGTWDSLTAPVVCTPIARNLGNGPGVGTALVTATASGVTSAPITVFVHKAVDNVAISPQSPDCVSQTKTVQFTAKAFANGVDVTPTVGTFVWPAPNASVATIDANGLATSVAPGKTAIYASVGSVQSTPAQFISCPVAQINIHVANGTATTATFDKAATQALTADLIDSNNQPLTNVAVDWNTSQPLVSAAAAGSLTGGSAGTTTVTASCSNPTCNIGLPDVIYSNAFVVNVNGTSTTNVWVASTQGTSVVPIDTTTNVPGTAINLVDSSSNPVKPNSMLVNRQGTRLFLGTDSGMITVDLTTNTAGTPFTSAPGKVLAVSPDGNTIIVSNVGQAQVYVLTSSGTTSTTKTLNIAGAVSADFTPDSKKAYIVGNSNWTVWTSTTTPVPVNVGTANDVSFLATGAFGYIAGANPAARATCDDSTITSGTLSGTPTQVRALPDGTHLVAVASPNVELITADSDNKGCPPVLQSSTASTSLGGNFAARQVLVTPDGNKVFITSDQPGVLLGYDVANKVSAPIQLGGGVTATYTGGITLDSKQLYVGTAGANSIHRIDLTTGLDAQQIPVSFVPDLVVVQPK